MPQSRDAVMYERQAKGHGGGAGTSRTKDSRGAMPGKHRVSNSLAASSA